MIRLTGSGLDRAKACPAAYALPVIQESGGAADRGTAIHAYLEDGDLSSVPSEYADECASIDLDYVVPYSDGLDMREATFVFNADHSASRFIGCGLERAYGEEREGDIPITLDRVFNCFGNLCVVDYKTGEYAPSADCLQLALGAVCAFDQYPEEDEIQVAIVHLPPGGGCHWYWHSYDSMGLELIRMEVAQIYEGVRNARAMAEKDVRVGEHCKYCPAIAACPSTNALAKTLLGPETTDAMVSQLTPEQAGEAWLKLAQAKSFVEGLDRALRRRIDAEGSLPLPGGKLVKPVTSTVKSIELAGADSVFEALGIDPIRKVTLPNKVAEAAAKEAGIKPKDMWKALAEAGVVKFGQKTSYRSVKGE